MIHQHDLSEKKNLDLIGMVKDMKQKYELNGVWYSLSELRSKLKTKDFTDVIISSI